MANTIVTMLSDRVFHPFTDGKRAPVAGEADIKPGTIIEPTSTAPVYQKHSVADGPVIPLVVIEKDVDIDLHPSTASIDVAYELNESMRVVKLSDEIAVDVILADSQVVTYGTRLQSNGDGTAKVAGVADATRIDGSAPFMAIEAVTSGVADDPPTRVRVIKAY